MRRVGTSACTDNTGGVSQVVTLNTAPTAPTSISGTTTICSGSSTTLTADGGGEGSGATYQWGTGSVGSNPISGNGASVTVSPNANTTYWVRRVGNSACANTTDGVSQAVTVIDVPEVDAITSPAAICVGEALDLTIPNVTYNGSAGSGIWQISETQNGSYTTFTNSNLQQGQDGYYIRYTATNDCGSTSNTGVPITVNHPNISISSSCDYVWRGGTSNWNIPSNWYEYNGGSYSVASSLPSEAKNYYIAIGGSGSCLHDVQQAYMNADATVNNIEIASGAELHIQENVTLRLAGSIINNGTFVADNSSIIELNGANDQTLSSAMEFGNITFAQVANNKKIIAPHGITVNGTATFTQGTVIGDMNFGSNASASGATLNSYVDGAVTKDFGSSDFTFPTGSNGVLGSVTVPATRATGSATIRFNKSTADGGFTTEEGYPRWWNYNDMCDDGNNRLHHVSNTEYWDISSSADLSNVTLSSVATSDVHFNNTVENAYDASDIKVAAYYGGCWKNIGGTASVDPYEEVAHSIITMTDVVIPRDPNRSAEGVIITLGSKNDNTVLPIELVSFTATCDGRSALVEWTTATEKNNDYFSLERSDDAVNFTEIARVAGAGNSIEPLDYSYTDYGIHGGDNYYRLVQVDYDGTRTTSEIIVANCIESEVDEPEVQAYPNPFSGELTLVLDNFDNRAATIEVYDMLGKLIYTEKASAPQNSYETILNLSNLPPAAYTVRVSTTDFVINKNVVKN